MGQVIIEKRDGKKEKFDKYKIEEAVKKAFLATDGKETEYAETKAANIADFIEEKVRSNSDPSHLFNVEEIQDLVENGLMSTKRKDVARKYIIYRNHRNEIRGNTTDKEIEEITSGTSDYWNSENSNKNPKIVTTQRDYLAGALSTDISRRKILPKDIVEAHDKGILHEHDMDYLAQNALTNCELLNLEDMLQNGTVINGTMIEKPHRFLTAATIATQIILSVTSSTYGGCTITLTHLAPFVRDSYNKYLNKYKKRNLSEEQCKQFAMEDTKKEVEDGVQTFNYQVNSMSNSNGAFYAF